MEYVVAEEKHEDGSPHLHAFIKYDKKDTWKEDKWDLTQDGVLYHGNY